MTFKHLILCVTIVLSGTSGQALATETVVLQPYIREIFLTGFTRAQREITISSEVSGRCLAVFADKGDTLEPPGLVAQLDDTFVLLDLEKNKIAQEQAKRRLELQNKTVDRYTTLIKNQSTPLTTLEEASLQADIYRLSLNNLKNEGLRLHELHVRLSIYGPAGWKVIERLAEPGEYISQGMQVLRLGDYTTLVVPVLLTYEELSLLHATPEVELYLPEVKLQVKAKVYRVAPGFDEVSKKIVVDLLIDQETTGYYSELRGGLLVHLNLKKNEETAFIVPYKSLINRYESYWLETLGRMRVKVVLLGKINNGAEAIISGEKLAEGDVYLASPEDRSGSNNSLEQ